MKIFTIFSIILCLFKSSFAGGIETSPVHLRITSRNHVAVLYVSNTKENPVTFQVQIYKWNQNSKKITKDIIVTPPIFTLGSNKTQVIRFGFYRFKDYNLQQTYRVVLKQLPFNESLSHKNKLNIKVLLNVSIPLTVEPKGKIIKSFASEIINKNNKLIFKIMNTGNVYMYFKKVTFESQNKKIFLNARNNHVLAHNKREWSVPLKNMKNSKEFNVVMDTSFGIFKQTFKYNVIKRFSVK